MNLLLTGATGKLGGCLIPKIGGGHKITCLVRPQSKSRALLLLRDTRAEIVEGDITAPSSLSKAMIGIDAVVHMAACKESPRPETMLRINVEGSANVAKAAALAGVRKIIHVSSIAAVQAPDEPDNVYAQSKLLAEQAIASTGVPTVIIRPTLILNEKHRILERLRLLRFLPVIALPKSFLDRRLQRPITIDDVADVIVRQIESAVLAPRTCFMISGSNRDSLSDLLKRISVVPFSPVIIPVPDRIVAIVLKLFGASFSAAGDPPASDEMKSDFEGILGREPKDIASLI